MQIMHKYFEEVRQTTIGKIELLKDRKFSATLDEWTSMKNRWFLNVNLHTADKEDGFFNLGLIRITGSCPAETVYELYVHKLEEFGLKADDIVGVTTDGARVMTRFGQMTQITHQQCYNHGVHLGVTDVLFKKIDSRPIQVEAADETESDGGDSEMEADDEDGNYNSDDVSANVRFDISMALKRVRRIVKLFKRSSVKNNFLQSHIIAAADGNGKELNLKLDCKTRWNSTDTMIERFLTVHNSVSSTLRELSLSQYLVKDLHNSLHPITMAVEALSDRNANLITAEEALQFLFDALKEQQGPIAQELYHSILKRVSERRNKDLVSLIKYMQNKDLKGSNELPLSSKKAIH